MFGETLVFGRLLDAATTPESRLALLAENIEGSIATVFRQVAMNRFEDLVHTARRDRGRAVASTRIGELWAESQEELLGDAVEVTEGYRTWWSYVPHFIGTPGYVYAYAYGQLLALSVYGRYLAEGEAFVPKYLELLAAGGSRSPEELAAIVGLDLTDPGFWRAGLGPRPRPARAGRGGRRRGAGQARLARARPAQATYTRTRDRRPLAAAALPASDPPVATASPAAPTASAPRRSAAAACWRGWPRRSRR